MRKLSIVFSALLFGACAGAEIPEPVSFSAPAASSTDQAMECVRRELDDMAYEMPPAIQSSSTSVTAIRVNEQPWWLKMVGYRNTADQILVTMAGGQLQVTGRSSDPAESSGGGEATSGASEAVARNARDLLDSCGRDT